MRILHACKHFHPRVTGVTAHVENLCREQRRGGHQPAVATWGRGCRDAASPDVPVLQAEPGDVEGLARRIEEYRPEVIHAHSIWDTTFSAVLAARHLGRPYVVTAHGTWQLCASARAGLSLRDRLSLCLWRRRVLWPRILRDASAVISLNAQEERDALAAGVDRQRIVFVPNAVDVETFRPPGPEPRFPARPDCYTVLFVGSMEGNKGVWELLEAAATLRDSLPRVRWLLCGDGPELERLRRAASARRLEAVVRFEGSVKRTDMPAMYHQADALAAPSHAEAFSTALLEGMASALPCVGSAVGGTPTIIDQGRTGLLIAPGDPMALADAVVWLANRPEKARVMGQAGRAKAEREFSWPTVAGRIERVYRLALAACLLLAWLGLAGQTRAADVIPVDILTMIDPLNGRDIATASRGWQRSNAVWRSGSITLAAARGETAAFQLVFLTGPGERLENVRIWLDLPGQMAWKAFRAWHIWDVPEVAVPLDDRAGTFDIPGAPWGRTASGHDVVAWTCPVEIRVPRDPGPSRLECLARITWDGGEARMPLVLSVLPLDLPERPGFVLEMNSYGDYLRLLPGTLRTFLDIHHLFRAFRCTFTLVPYRQDGRLLHQFLAPAIGPDLEPDFAGFDSALSGLFDGSAFEDGQPVSRFILPLCFDWPAAFGPDRAAFRQANASMRLALARHIRDKGWLATSFQEFHNENPEHGSSCPWRLDEPATARDLDGHDMFLSLRDAACGMQGQACPLRYRIDISDWFPLRNRLLGLAGRVTDWSVSADPRFLDARTVDFFRSLGPRSLIAYGELPGFMARGRPTPWMRFPLLLARFHALGLDGYAQWIVDRWKDQALGGVDPGSVPLFYSNASGARDLIWPGAFFGLEQPLPSLRLFALREGLNILDYLDMVQKCRPQALGGLHREFEATKTPEALYAFKMKLAAMVARECRP